jgi:hypothetical protein
MYYITTKMSEAVSNVNKQHHLYKPDSECSPITLIMRKFYGNASSRGERYTRQKLKAVERYKNDPELREKHRIYQQERRKKLKAEKEELETKTAEVSNKSEDV